MKAARKSSPLFNPDSETASVTVFSARRNVSSPPLRLPQRLEAKLNKRMRRDGLKFLRLLDADSVPVVFFDPQYRGILDKMRYGNEGEKRGRARSALKQMDERTITQFMQDIDRILTPSGHLFLWIDKFHLCTGFTRWLCETELEVVDMLTWNKGRIGMGYRTRRMSEHLVILQKKPRRAKGVWQLHDIPDVWREEVRDKEHTHQKPLQLQSRLIEAVSGPGDLVVDPAAGSFSVLEACRACGRNFLGCDLNG